MKIFVDADACPAAVKEIVIRAAERLAVSAIFVANKNIRLPPSRHVSTVRVAMGLDVADGYIAKSAKAGDLAVTADIPLAAALERGWRAACDMHQTSRSFMTKSRGFTLLPITMTVAAVAAGLALGVVAYAFHYARGASYLGNDPATCANCHVMAGHYSAWQAAPHHTVATCNDCHTPAGPISKYVVKATNGWHHSFAFTMGGFPDVIRARPESSAIVEANCRRCHADLVDEMAHGGETSCIHCHVSVGHLR